MNKQPTPAQEALSMAKANASKLQRDRARLKTLLSRARTEYPDRDPVDTSLEVNLLKTALNLNADLLDKADECRRTIEGWECFMEGG